MSHAEEGARPEPPDPGVPHLRAVDPAAPVDPVAARRGDRPARHRAGVLAAVREGVVVIVAAMVLSLLVKTFLAQAFYIPSESMELTLEPGDRVMVSLLTPGPFDLQRGDVVVFADPDDWLPAQPEPQRGPLAGALVGVLRFVGILPHDSGGHLIKRLIGLPGDRVVCCDVQGRLSVNGAALDEEAYLYPGDEPSTGPGDGAFDVVVEPGHLWVMGDHRSQSQDSRFHTLEPGGGAVPVEAVVGRAVLTVWPVPRWTLLSGYHEVFDRVPDQAPVAVP